MDAEITVDLVLRARGNMQLQKANEPDDFIVTEMLKELPIESTYEIAKLSQRRFRRECDRRRGKTVQFHDVHVSDAAVGEGAEGGVNREHTQVLVTSLLQKQLENERNTWRRWCSMRADRYKTMYLAGVGVKTAFHVAKPIIANMLMETGGSARMDYCGTAGRDDALEWAIKESCETEFRNSRFVRQRGVEAPTLCMKLASGGKDRARGGAEGDSGYQICSMLWADNFWIICESEMGLQRMMGRGSRQHRYGTEAGITVVDEHARQRGRRANGCRRCRDTFGEEVRLAVSKQGVGTVRLG